MFGHTYFGKRYYGQHYWGGVGGVIIATIIRTPTAGTGQQSFSTRNNDQNVVRKPSTGPSRGDPPMRKRTPRN